MNQIVTEKEAADWRDGPADADLDHTGLVIRRNALRRRLLTVSSKIRELSARMSETVARGGTTATLETEGEGIRSRTVSSGTEEGNAEIKVFDKALAAALPGSTRPPKPPKERPVEAEFLQACVDGGILNKVINSAKKAISTRDIAERIYAEVPDLSKGVDMPKFVRKLSRKLMGMSEQGQLVATDGDDGRVWRKSYRLT